MEPFGKYLTRTGVISAKQLEDATQTLVVFGGRLGSHLVELGHLEPDDLERHLSAYLGVRTPPARWVERPDPRALKALKPSVIERHRAEFELLERDTAPLEKVQPPFPRVTWRASPPRR